MREKHPINQLSAENRVLFYSFLSPLKLLLLARTNNSFYVDRGLWQMLIKKVFSINEKEKNSDEFKNEPKKMFYQKVKALEESIKNNKGIPEEYGKSIAKFLVTGESGNKNFLLSKEKIREAMIVLVKEHNMNNRPDGFDLSTPTGQGNYVAKWLLENLDFPFQRAVNSKIEKSDKNLFSEVPNREKLNFQTKEGENAIFSIYKDKNFTAKGLEEDQCKMEVLNFINLRFYENSNMDTEHSTPFDFFAGQLNDLLNYLNDEKNTVFKKAFLGHEGSYGNHNQYKISDFFVEEGGKSRSRGFCVLWRIITQAIFGCSPME